MRFMNRLLSKKRNIYRVLARALNSRKFLWLIIAFFLLESLWVVFSFNYPIVYDEKFHFDIIKIYTHQFSPIIFDQPPSYDYLRDLTHEGSKLYHYLMSWPLRFGELFTSSQTIQIIYLRILNTIMAAAGLVVFARLFRRINVRQSYINTALLVFVLIPLVPMVAATVNYDNMLFLLTALYVSLCVRLLQNHKKITGHQYVNLISLGCLASLVKFTFLPVFLASLIYLGVFLGKTHGRKALTYLTSSIRETKKSLLAASFLILFITGGLFSMTYIQNTIRYGRPDPTCQETMTLERCLASGVVARNEQARVTKNQRPTMSLPDYTQLWFKNMIYGSTFSPAYTTDNKNVAGSPLPIVYGLVFFGSITGVLTLLYAWRGLRKDRSWQFLALITAVLFVSVYLFNVRGYYAIHNAFANQPRYLLSMLPFLLIMIVASVGYVLRKWRWPKVAALAAVLLLLSQGGGIATHILRSEDNWYWQNSRVIQVNHAAKKVLSPLIREHRSGLGL